MDGGGHTLGCVLSWFSLPNLDNLTLNAPTAREDIEGLTNVIAVSLLQYMTVENLVR